MKRSTLENWAVLAFGLIGFSLVVLGYIGVQRHQRRPQSRIVGNLQEAPGLRPGDSARISTLQDLDGKPVRLYGDRDYSVLCFFSVLCAKCFDEIEVWRRLAAADGSRSLRTFLLSVDTDPQKIRKSLAAYGIADLPVLYDPADHLRENFRIQVMPQYLVLDRQGKVLHRELGYLETLGLTAERRAQSILAAAPPRQAAPAMAVDLAGHARPLLGADGYSVLAFFSRECSSCSGEAEVWRALRDASREQPFEFSMLIRDSRPEQIRPFVQANDLGDLPVLYDPQGRVFARYGISEVPQYVLVDRSGQVLLRLTGESAAQGIRPEDRVQSVLAAISASRTGSGS